MPLNPRYVSLDCCLALCLALIFFVACSRAAQAGSPDLLAGIWVIDAQASAKYFSCEEEVSEQDIVEMLGGISCYFNLLDMEVVVTEWGMEIGRRKIEAMVRDEHGYILRINGKEEKLSFLPDGKLRLDEESGETTIFKRP